MTFVLNEFVENTKILPSKVNENFEGLQGDITDNYTELDGRLDTVDSTLTNIQSTLSGAAYKYVPTGTVIWYAKNDVPNGYLLCNGSAVSRTDYADLFEEISTTYGAGDGSTTFNLPNLTGRFIEGGTPGSYISAGLPNITGSFAMGKAGYTGNGVSADGAFYWAGNVFTGNNANPDGSTALFGFSAALSNAIYDNSITTVQPPALTLLPCIKY